MSKGIHLASALSLLVSPKLLTEAKSFSLTLTKFVLPVFCHQSLGTYHLSTVTCNPWHVICHMSQVTYHMSHITCRMLPLICHLSPVSNAISISGAPPPANSPIIQKRLITKLTSKEGSIVKYKTKKIHAKKILKQYNNKKL